MSGLDINDGRLQWRSIISKHSQFQKLILADFTHGAVTRSAVITLTLEHDYATDKGFSWFLRSWSSDQGKLLWETLLQIEGGREIPNRPVDLVYDKRRSMVTVLVNNALYFVSISYESIVSSGSWYSNHSVASEEFLLSQLLSPTQASNIQDLQSVAVGCVVSKKSMTRCTAIGIVGVTYLLESTTVNVALLSGNGELSPRSGYASVSGKDFVIGTSDAPYSVAILPTSGSEKVLQLKPSLSELKEAFGGEGSSSDAITATLLGGDTHDSSVYTSTAVSVTFCRKSSGLCATFTIAKVIDDWKMKLISPVGGGGGGMRCDHFRSVASRGRQQSKDFCMTTSFSVASDSTVFNKMVVRSIDSASIAVEEVEHVFNMNLPLQTNENDHDALHHISLHAGSSSLLGLLVFHTGLTMLVRLSATTSDVVWTRDESLSRLKQVVIIDNLAVEEGELDTLTLVGEQISIPTFEQRLELQKKEMIKLLATFTSSMLHLGMSLPSYVDTHTHTYTHTHKNAN